MFRNAHCPAVYSLRRNEEIDMARKPGWRQFCVALAITAIFAATGGEEPQPKPKPRAARSVHLAYTIPAPAGTKTEADRFYNEVTVEQSTPNTYFMACGFAGGYCGVQELGKGKKIVIFSVWDPGQQNDSNSVKPEDRTKILLEGKGVNVSRFGGEGTGGKSIFPYDWKIGEPQRFVITSKTDGSSSTFAAYFYLNDKKEWKHLATFQTIARKSNLAGLYSFIEDFRRDGKSADELRRARFTNPWVRTLDGQWHPLVKARFTADSTPLENNDAGLNADGEFYLTTGGDAKRSRELRSIIERTPNDTKPPEVPKE
jgi:hypothetical protein